VYGPVPNDLGSRVRGAGREPAPEGHRIPRSEGGRGGAAGLAAVREGEGDVIVVRLHRHAYVVRRLSVGE